MSPVFYLFFDVRMNKATVQWNQRPGDTLSWSKLFLHNRNLETIGRTTNRAACFLFWTDQTNLSSSRCSTFVIRASLSFLRIFRDQIHSLDCIVQVHNRTIQHRTTLSAQSEFESWSFFLSIWIIGFLKGRTRGNKLKQRTSWWIHCREI